jgi:hypothetical protein
MPHQRFVFVPQPVMGKSPQELRAYVDGLDPITGRPFMEEVVSALTEPLTERETGHQRYDRSTPRSVEAGSEQELHDLFLGNNWTDQLPIVLPTAERVEAMLAGSSHKADEVVGHMRPTSTREAWEFTVEKVAVNAVMAGAKPEYFPVILALAASETTARGSTTSSSANMVMVNGPIREEIAMNSGIGAMGPYNHANATIGRAYGLLSQNLQGGSVPQLTYLGSQGNGYGYGNPTFAENEERSPWVPFHVEKGFDKSQSVVSIIADVKTTSFLLGLREKHWREHVIHMLRGMNPFNPPTLVLDPITARQFVERGGFDTKEKLAEWIYEVATIKAGEYWDYQLIQNYVYPRAINGEEPFASLLEADPEKLIPMFRKAAINVVVVGGETNGYWRIMGCHHARSVCIDDWR